MVFYVFFATACVQRSDPTWTVRNKDVELDVKMNCTLSYYNECPLLLNFHLGLDARCNSTTEGPSPLRLRYPFFFFESSLQDGIGELGVIGAFLSLPTTTTAEMWRTQETLETGRMNFSLTRGVRKLSLNCLCADRNNNNFDFCRPLGN